MFDRSGHEVFVEKAYRDTFTLLEEVRDYVADNSGKDDDGIAPQDRAMLVHELTKITRRLTDSMAWLMLQKAVAADEIDAEEAAQKAEGVLPGPDVGEAGKGADLMKLPLAVRGMIDRSRRIYIEVERLETSIRDAAAR